MTSLSHDSQGEYPMIDQPSNLTLALYPHQRVSVYRMEELEGEQKIVSDENGEYSECRTNFGINSDKTGYGKTLSMIALILRDKMNWNFRDFSTKKYTTYNNENILLVHKEFYPKINATLIVCSPSIINQWEEEFSHTNLRVFAVRSKKYLLELKNIQNLDVVIVTPVNFNKVINRYHGMAWKRFIFDEPAHIRVPAMRKIIFGFMWLVTATPGGIYYKHQNCHSSFMRPISLNINCYREYITVENDEKFLEESFKMPTTLHQFHMCRSNLLQTIAGIASPKVYQLIDQGNITAALKKLGGTSTENIVDLLVTRKHQEIKEINGCINLCKLRDDDEKITEWEQKILRIEKQITDLQKRFENSLNQQCCICMESITKPVLEPGCQNVFCGECIFTWMKTKTNCPLCRRHINGKKLIYIEKKEKPEPVEKKKESKLLSKEDTMLKIILQKNRGSLGKFIIFSEHFESFYTMRQILEERGVKSFELRGSATTRHKIIQKYKDEKSSILFLNAAHDSSGINLQETTDIIMYHEMSNYVTQQIIGRANRLGRTQSLTVHHMKYR